MIKQNDMVLNILANPTFEVRDIQAVGLKADKTNFRTEDEYLKSEKITKNPLFSDEKGNFDKGKFHEFYVGAGQFYNQLAQQDYRKTILDSTMFSEDNIWVEPNKRKISYAPKLVRTPNEYLVRFICKSGFDAKSRKDISEEIIITYGINPFDICSDNPDLWNFIKLSYIFTFVFSNVIISNFTFNRFINKFKFFKKYSTSNSKDKIHSNNFKNTYKKNDLNLLIGLDKDTDSKIYIPESGLYQNFLITGTIGSGKTSSAMYPFTEQLIRYNSNNPDKKIGMLILDVKGNYYKQVKYYTKKYNLLNDLITIQLNSNVFYNPLHKPNLKPQVLANRLKTILLLFSENNTESYWIDKAEQILTECIKLCRLYNNGYVTFLELHKLITIPNYYKEKISILRELFISSKLNTKQIYDLNNMNVAAQNASLGTLLHNLIENSGGGTSVNEKAEIVEKSSYLLFPSIGNSKNIYVDSTDNIIYRWDEKGLRYYQISYNYNNLEEIIGGNANG